MNSASRKLHHDQQVERNETSQAPDLDGEEVRGRKAFPVRFEERAPRRALATLWTRFDSVLLEDFGHGCAGDPVAQISQGTLDSRLAPARRFPGNANCEVCDLLHHGRPTRISPFGAVVPLLGDQPPMPPKDRVRRHDRGDLGQYPGIRGLFSILLAEVLDHGILVAADPPSRGDDEDLPWTNHLCHGWRMKHYAAIG